MLFLPTKVFSRLWPYICPIVTNIVNLSMSSGIFPDVLKMAHIKPLLKSPTLDTEADGLCVGEWTANRGVP